MIYNVDSEKKRENETRSEILIKLNAYSVWGFLGGLGWTESTELISSKGS